jgi:hypothetical protein
MDDTPSIVVPVPLWRDQRHLRSRFRFSRPTVMAMNFHAHRVTTKIRQFGAFDAGFVFLFHPTSPLSPASANQTCFRIFLSFRCTVTGDAFVVNGPASTPRTDSLDGSRGLALWKKRRLDLDSRSAGLDWQVDVLAARRDASSSGKAIGFFRSGRLASFPVTSSKRD